jgi:hypothetical protein
MWTQHFLHQESAPQGTANVVLDVLHDVFCSHVPLNRFPERLFVSGTGHHVHRT